MGEEPEIGRALLPAKKVLLKEPDRGGGFNAVGPRILMHWDDVEQTGVIQPGSRVTYKLLVAGDSDALAEWSAEVAANLPDGIRLFGVRGGAEQIGRALERAERFLLLGSLLAVVLAGIAIALSAHRFADRHLDHIALLKTVGATPQTIDRLFIGMFVLLGLTTTFAGSFGSHCSVGSLGSAGALYSGDLAGTGLFTAHIRRCDWSHLPARVCAASHFVAPRCVP